MKKMIKILLFILLIMCFQNVNIAYSSNSKIKIVNISDENYSAEVHIENTTYNTIDELYVGQHLYECNLICKVYNNGIPVEGIPKWEYSGYVVTQGNQLINIIFKIDKEDDIRISITLEAIDLNKNRELKHLYGVDYSDYVFERYEGSTLYDIVPIYRFWSTESKNVDGVMEYFNYEDLSIGYHEIGWRFTPSDPIYETKEGIYKVNIIARPEPVVEEIEEPTTPSLTAISVIMTDIEMSYDINLNDKISGSSYNWTTSDDDIIDINPKNGLVKAKKEGKAKVYCEITLPDNTTQILESDVVVGFDENAPVLTEYDLELEIGDKFTIGVENITNGSKVSWKSSDKNVVKVNTKGKLTTIGVGEAYLTCTITTPENQVIILRCDIEVSDIIDAE